MNIEIKKLFNQTGIETGAVLSVVLSRTTNLQEKNLVESQLIQFAFNKLYPEETISIFQEIYIDTPSITVIKRINDLPPNSTTI